MKFRRAVPLLALLALTSAPSLARLSPLATPPIWGNLDKYQGSMTREDFVTLLGTVYAPSGTWKPFITIGDRSALIQTSLDKPRYELRFAPTQGTIRPAPRYWRARAQLPARPASQPLNGIRIAIDPGHLGGPWAKTEERWFQIGNQTPVTEGDLTLAVARLLVPRLQALGAEVTLTRHKAAPVTPLRPDRLRKAALASLADQKKPATKETIQKESERLFYRVSEIDRRAILINERIRPDLTLCLHFNAEAWGDEHHPTLTDKDHLHLIVNGTYSGDELTYDDERFALLQKLLSRTYREELALSESVAASMAKATGLPPYRYTGSNATPVGSGSYVWARNLLANRIYQCPVIYVEAYVMNSRAAYARIQAGDYPGKKAIDGHMQPSILREYADALTRGLVNYYTAKP